MHRPARNSSSTISSSPSPSMPSSPLHFFSPKSRETPSSTPEPERRHNFSQSMMEENINNADLILTKWDINGSTYCKLESLFTGDRREAKAYLRSVRNLQKSMHFFLSEDSKSGTLVRAQNLMQIAMKRLQKEFYQILSRNRIYLDPETVSVSYRSSRLSTARSSTTSEDDDEITSTSDDAISEMVMADLKAIADCMISSGYAKECLKIYKLQRKSIVDENLYYLGVERLSLSQIQKLDWELIEMKLKKWLPAVKIAVNNLFNGERILCDHVFSSSPRIAESCFTDISTVGAMSLFGFPELVARSKKLSPEKIFQILDLYDSIAYLWPVIDSIFSFESSSDVKLQVVTSLIKLGEAVRSMLSDFETAIQKDVSKSPVPGGGIHPLTRYVMNYLVFLSDYNGIVSDIVADWPLTVQSPLPETYFSNPSSGDEEASVITVRLTWLILILLCKLDSRAELFNDVSLSYLFLANNLNYILKKVRNSKLKLLLGDQWLIQHEDKLKKYIANYERMGWFKVVESLSKLNQTADISPGLSSELFRGFNSVLADEFRKQAGWVVPDNKMRDEIKVSLAGKILPPYMAVYDRYRGAFGRRPEMEALIRYAPEDLSNLLWDLFFGVTTENSSTTSSPYRSGSSPSSSPSWSARSGLAGRLLQNCSRDICKRSSVHGLCSDM
ncbi:exocyst complex component EXO70H1-like [Impatiens glandulifera]|uniref:exocyst complex component EXO70H1-like n=1 Tax=Impatiens glandulifera TaxID=253017 RepID=UPI001FB06BF9|nr:exocyst complex component EXO70H1-like [Impatiens glandulifera]